MNHVKLFLKEKGVYLALLACIFGAAIASFWAIRNVIARMVEYSAEEQEWDLPSEPVTGETENVPKSATPSPTAQTSSAPSYGGYASSGSASASAEPESMSEPSVQPADSLIWPVDGQMQQEYSGDDLVYNATLKDWRTHNGMDIAAPLGTRVVAVEDGTITAVYNDALWGNVVEQEADGKIWRYCGLEPDPRVTAGQTVQAGDTVGKLGTVDAEADSDSHLHLELLRGGQYIDPQTYLK